MNSPRGNSAERQLIESFRFLSATAIATTATKVCKQWRAAAQQDELWKWFYYTDFPLGSVLNAHSLISPRDAYRLYFRKQVRLYSFSILTNSVHIYNLHYRQATTHKFSSSVRIFSQQGWKVLSNGLLFICGGADLGNNVANEVKTIDTERWKVDLLPPLKKARASPGVGEFGDHVYVFGGIDIAKMTRSDRFNICTRKWTSLPGMPTAKHLFSPVVHCSKFWLMSLDGIEIEEFDPVSLTYRNLYIRIPSYTSIVAAVSHREKVYYFGVDQHYCVALRNGMVDGSAADYECGVQLGYCAQATIYREQVFLLRHDNPVPKQVLSFLITGNTLVYNGVIYCPEDAFPTRKTGAL